MNSEKLFEPIMIGPVQIKNRLAVAPMTGRGDQDGHPTLQYTSYYNARALGGYGLITTGAIVTNEEAAEDAPGVTNLYIGKAKNFVRYGKFWWGFADSIHSMGTDTKIFAEMSLGFGRQSGIVGAKGASPIPMDINGFRTNWNQHFMKDHRYFVRDPSEFFAGIVPREMTIEEIHEDQLSFVNACVLAIVYGFDGITLHFCHGYLGHQFLSPRTNQRKDEYGGSLKNRARILLELVAMLKATFGATVPIVVRISAEERQRDGNSAEDQRQIAVWCEEAGADAIDLSRGSGYDDMTAMIGYEGDNIELLKLAKELKKAVRVPVIMPGLQTPEVAELAVRDGDIDIVSHARESMADPEWPNKVKEGRTSEILKCTRCDWCAGMGTFGGTWSTNRCTVNPNSGFEQYMPECWPKPNKVKVPETLARWQPGRRWEPSWKPGEPESI